MVLLATLTYFLSGVYSIVTLPFLSKLVETPKKTIIDIVSMKNENVITDQCLRLFELQCFFVVVVDISDEVETKFPLINSILNSDKKIKLIKM
ncbi:hypothetical protein BLOT_012493 [Blomia tropicalis]|nr:hypothetical protein BLOT_012493 [Blomia tropicalis]